MIKRGKESFVGIEMKNFLIVIVLLYAPCIMSQFKVVQNSTLEALELYEHVDDVLDEKEVSGVDQEEEADEEVASHDQSLILEKDPEQYFVDKKEVQERINQHEILEYTLDEVLDRAREYPGYYGDSDKEEITAWYEQAQQNFGNQKEIFDRIKNDAKRYSLERILHRAQNDALYKGAIPYQKIVDAYYEINPEKVSVAQHAFAQAIRFLHLDTFDQIHLQDMKIFLMEYRKLPTSLQDTIQMKILPQIPSRNGAHMKHAKNLVDWIIAHKLEYADLKETIAVLQS